MRLALAASGAGHALALLASVAVWHGLRPQDAHEAEAKIEVIFGKGASVDGAPAPGSATAAAAAASGAARATPSAAPSPPIAPPPAARVAAARPAAGAPSSAPAAASTRAAAGASDFAPVRLGDGEIGFDVAAADRDLVAAQADPGNEPPRYPRQAVLRHEEGTAVLGIHVGRDGLVARIDLLRSSGYPDLDAAAQTAALAWHFLPQFRDGAPVPSYREQPIAFVFRRPK